MSSNKIELKSYYEPADQVISKLHPRARIIELRENYIECVETLDIGSTTAIAEIKSRLVNRCSEQLLKNANENIQEHNLIDFTRGTSGLYNVAPNSSRLAVHIFVWTTYVPYRQIWGDFDPDLPPGIRIST